MQAGRKTSASSKMPKGRRDKELVNCTGEMSHLQLSMETRPAWHGDQWYYTRPSYSEFVPMAPVQPRALFVL